MDTGVLSPPHALPFPVLPSPSPTGPPTCPHAAAVTWPHCACCGTWACRGTSRGAPSRRWVGLGGGPAAGHGRAVGPAGGHPHAGGLALGVGLLRDMGVPWDQQGGTLTQVGWPWGWACCGTWACRGTSRGAPSRRWVGLGGGPAAGHGRAVGPAGGHPHAGAPGRGLALGLCTVCSVGWVWGRACGMEWVCCS